MTTGLALNAEEDGVFKYQNITLKDGRNFDGRLNKDKTELTIIDKKKNKNIMVMKITPEDIESVTEETGMLVDAKGNKSDAKEKASTPGKADSNSDAKNADQSAVSKLEGKIVAQIHLVDKNNQQLIELKKKLTEELSEYRGKELSEAKHKSEQARFEKYHKSILDADQVHNESRNELRNMLKEYKEMGGSREFKELLEKE